MEPTSVPQSPYAAIDLVEGRRRHGAGDLPGAETIYRALLAARPDDAAVLHLLGVVRHQRGRPAEAVELIEAALQRAPDLAAAWQNIVLPLAVLGRGEDALRASAEAVRRAPDSSGAWTNRALAALVAENPALAAEAAEVSIALDPAQAVAWEHLGNARLRQGRADIAERHFRRSLAIGPGRRDALFGLASALEETDRPNEAAVIWRGLVERDPGDVPARTHLGAALRAAGDVAGAVAAWADGPRSPVIDYNLGCAQLLAGDWAAGWRGYERRWDVPVEPVPAKVAGLPLWSGAGRVGTLLVHHEQGLGDSVQFVCLVPRLLDRVGRVVLVCQRPLKALITGMVPIRAAGERVVVVADGDPLPACDAWVALLSLPHRLGLVPETVAARPYVVAEPARVARWRARLDALPAPRGAARPFRVGVVWQGNPKAPVERGRSFPLAVLAPLAAVPGVQLISLQKGVGTEQVASVPFPVHGLGDDFDAGSDAFLDTVAVGASLDLVVSSCTSTAHVLAAAGRPVWLMLRAVPDWRWGTTGETTPWYPTMRLFRQSRRGDWAELASRVAEALRAAAAAGGRDDAALARAFDAAIERHRGGRPDLAIPDYRRRLLAAPDDARAMNFLGLALLETGRGDPAAAAEAASLARTSAALAGGDRDIVSNAAVVLKSLGRADEAEALLRRVLATDPAHPPSVQNLVNLLIAEGEAGEAVRVANAAAGRTPREPTILKSLAAALRAVKRPAEAAAALRLALAQTPDDVVSRNTLGSVLVEAGDEAGARTAFEEVLERAPDDVDGFSNLGVVEKRLAGPELAIWFYHRALARNPRNVDARANLGSALVEMGRWDLAGDVFRAALQLRPDHPEARMALGMTLLAAGRYEEGFREYEGRIRSERLGLLTGTPKGVPRWQGEPIEGRSVLVIAEQGFGDILQFVRYATVLKAMGASRVVVGCRARLGPLLATAAGVDAVAVEGGPVPKVDFHVFAMSLPHLCGTTLDTVPAPVPYLAADPERVTAWAERLAARPGFRVGIVWQGNPDPGVDRGRSLPLAMLEPLAAVPGVRLIALQKGPGSEQVAALGDRFAVESLGPDFDEGPAAFLDTAAVMANLDLVVTTDTSVLHLAGALGRPTFALLKRHAEWRFMREREDTPWYPTVRLFRQTDAEADTPAPFAGPIRRAAEALAAVVRGDRLALSPRPAGTQAPAPARPVADRFAAALALHRAGQTERARGLYTAVLADEPGHVEAVHMLGAMAMQAQEWRRALILLREAGRMGLSTGEYRANLAVALRRTGRTEEAATLLRALIAEEPRAEAHATLGGILADDGRFAEALPQLERAVTLDPRNALFRRNLGNALREAGRYEAALAELEQAVTLAPEDAEARIDRAHARLILGDYAGGFADYEWRFGGLEMGRRAFAVPRWDGYPFPGTLLVHGEQGLGDHIQFVRFVRMAAERCDRVLLEVRRPLMGLFGHLHPNVTVVEQGGDLPPFDAEVAILSLPHVLGLGRDGLGMDAPYLFAEVARIARWRDWLGRFDGLTVGLAWQGNPKARADKGRSPPLAALAPLFQVPGVRFVALQKEHGLDQLGAFSGAPILRPPPEFDAGPDAFLDSAAVMAVADLVVTSDTALAHLAGALARPTFLMLKHSPDWRWLAAGETSPWYPTMRLVRQPARGDWAAVGRAVAAAFRAVATP